MQVTKRKEISNLMCTVCFWNNLQPETQLYIKSAYLPRLKTSMLIVLEQLLSCIHPHPIVVSSVKVVRIKIITLFL